MDVMVTGWGVEVMVTGGTVYVTVVYGETSVLSWKYDVMLEVTTVVMVE